MTSLSDCRVVVLHMLCVFDLGLDLVRSVVDMQDRDACVDEEVRIWRVLL